MLDIRMPIGLLFGLVGLLLVVHGLTSPRELYAVSLGFNVNLLWGGVMAVFGACMGAAMVLWPEREAAEHPDGQEVQERQKVVPASHRPEGS